MGLGKCVHSHVLSVPVAIKLSVVALIVEILLSATVVDKSK